MDDIRAKHSPSAAERLPDLRLPSAPAGSPVPLVPAGGRLVPIVAAVHGAGCDACRDFVRELAGADAELREWDARVVVVVPGGMEEATRFAVQAGIPLPVLADEERRVWTRMAFDGAAVLVADPWGEVRMRHVPGASHDLPVPAELVDWARFIAIQCPECEGEAW